MLLNRFAKDRDGNVAMIFALAIIPIIGFVGAAVDYSRAAKVRTQIQGAIDSAALMLAKEASKLTKEQLGAKGQQYFNDLFKAPDVTVVPTVKATSSLNTETGVYTVKVSVSASTETTFTRVIGIKKIDIASSGEVVWGMKRLELALALDNTGSMDSNNKMTELKKATRGLLNTLFKSAKKAGDVKVAIIPFATDVNVGKSNKDATWLDWTDWAQNNGSCSGKNGSKYTTKSSCEAANRNWTATKQSDWNGCVWDRDQPYDTNDTAPTSATTKFEPHQASACPAEMIDLTDIYTNNAWVEADLTSSTPTSVLGKKINEMNPTGNTNVTIGMAWGWHAVTKNDPLTSAADPKEDLDKVVILLTDGKNTQNRFSDVDTVIDARTKLACANAKAASIKVYTIRVIDGNADLLRECATNPNMYYDVQNASQLNAVFDTIAQNLASLRIAK